MCTDYPDKNGYKADDDDDFIDMICGEVLDGAIDRYNADVLFGPEDNYDDEEPNFCVLDYYKILHAEKLYLDFNFMILFFVTADPLLPDEMTIEYLIKVRW